MADPAMTVEVVTPEQSLFSGPAEAVVLRSSDGDLTILPGHTPLVTDVAAGPVRVDQPEGDPVRLAVHGGYLQVDTGAGTTAAEGAGEAMRVAQLREARDGAQAGADASREAPPETGDRGTTVRLLAGVAELAEDIDTERAELAKAEAEARVTELEAAAGRSEAPRPTEESEAGPAAPDVELSEAQGALQRAEVRLRVARGEDASST
jgi:F-type H+-transporting ATPase subunit epsilon